MDHLQSCVGGQVMLVVFETSGEEGPEERLRNAEGVQGLFAFRVWDVRPTVCVEFGYGISWPQFFASTKLCI